MEIVKIVFPNGEVVELSAGRLKTLATLAGFGASELLAKSTDDDDKEFYNSYIKSASMIYKAANRSIK